MLCSLAMRRISFAVVAALLSLGAMGCPSGPKKPHGYPPPTAGPPPRYGPPASAEQLVHHTLGALMSGNAEAYVRQMLTYQEFRHYCPFNTKLAPQTVAMMHHSARSSFHKCLAKGDWRGAGLVRIWGANRRPEIARGCHPSVQNPGDLGFVVRLRDGKIVEVKLYDPLVIEGRRWTSTVDGPSCSVRGMR